MPLYCGTMTFIITTISITTLNMMTFIINGLFVAPRIAKLSFMQIVIMLCVAFYLLLSECHYAECRGAFIVTYK
jgi:hypothetical protein